MLCNYLMHGECTNMQFIMWDIYTYVYLCVFEKDDINYKVYTNELSKVEYIGCGKIKKEYRVSHLVFEMLREEISVPLYTL